MSLFTLSKLRGLFTPMVLVLSMAAGSCQEPRSADDAPGVVQDTPDIRGAWAAESYQLAGGPVHPVAGRIFFAERDWQVLFFVLDADGAVARGSGEGGGYELRGDSLVLTHLFNLSVGDAMEGLPAAALRMTARAEDGAPEEPTRVERVQDALTLFFPSGNRMTFLRR